MLVHGVLAPASHAALQTQQSPRGELESSLLRAPAASAALLRLRRSATLLRVHDLTRCQVPQVPRELARGADLENRLDHFAAGERECRVAPRVLSSLSSVLIRPLHALPETLEERRDARREHGAHVLCLLLLLQRVELRGEDCCEHLAFARRAWTWRALLLAALGRGLADWARGSD